MTFQQTAEQLNRVVKKIYKIQTKKMSVEVKKLFYNITLSQTLSTCGDYLFAGNNFGEIFVFWYVSHRLVLISYISQNSFTYRRCSLMFDSISHVCATTVEQIDEVHGKTNDLSDEKQTFLRPHQVFKVSEDGQSIRSLAFHSNYLIVGMAGVVTGYSWFKNRLTKKLWEISLPVNNETSSQQNDINCFWLDKTDNILYAGCGDNNIYAINLEDGQVLRSFGGHTNYVHWIDGGNDHNLYSASEDGSIKFWDRRDKRAVNQLEPYKNEVLVRSQFGKWQGTVAVTDDWLICGGGPRVSLWHLRSMECTTVFPFIKPARVSGFLDDVIYVGGDYNRLCQYNLKGGVTAEVPVSSSSVYSVVAQTLPDKFLSIAGASNSLDICTNYNYRDVVLNLYQSQSQSHNQLQKCSK